MRSRIVKNLLDAIEKEMGEAEADSRVADFLAYALGCLFCTVLGIVIGMCLSNMGCGI